MEIERDIRKKSDALQILDFVFFQTILILYIFTKVIIIIRPVNDFAEQFAVIRMFVYRLIPWIMSISIFIKNGAIFGDLLIRIKDKRNFALCLLKIGCLIGAIVYIYLNAWTMKQEPYYFLVSLYLMVFAYTQKFRTILKTYLYTYGIMFLFATLGVLAGITKDVIKTPDYGLKHSFGLVHPNTTGHVVFLIVICIWYLYLKKNRILTYFLFYLAGIILSIWNKCRTAIVILFLFPILVDVLLILSRKNSKVLGKIFPLAPWVGFAISLILSLGMDIVHRLMYHNFLRSFGERFVQAGIALRAYGLPLIGHSIDTSKSIRMVVDGKTIPLFVMDNSYISYGIILGIVWLLAALFLLSFGIRTAWLRHDIGLAAYAIIMCVFAMMERKGLDPVHNIMFIYGACMLGRRLFPPKTSAEKTRIRESGRQIDG